MRRLFAFLVFVVVVLVIVGFWRGWFTVLFNQSRFQHDEQHIVRKLDQAGDQLKQDMHSGAQKDQQKTGN